jgi:metal-sulfur cluster biosynthetic enzyme
MALNKEVVLDALKQVYDPEIPVDIVNLGLIYEVKIDGGKVDVKMTTTAPGCPMGNFIAAEVERVIIKIEGVGEVHVELVYDPPWSMDMVTKEGREMLGWR